MTTPRRRRARTNSISSASSPKRQKISGSSSETTDEPTDSQETHSSLLSQHGNNIPVYFPDLPSDSICHILSFLEPVKVAIVRNKLQRRSNARKNVEKNKYIATFPNQSRVMTNDCLHIKWWFGRFRNGAIDCLYRNMELDASETSPDSTPDMLTCILKHVRFLHFRAKTIDQATECLNSWQQHMTCLSDIYLHIKENNHRWRIWAPVSEQEKESIKALPNLDQALKLKIKDFRLSFKLSVEVIAQLLEHVPNVKRYHFAYCHEDCELLFRNYDFEYFRFLGGDTLDMRNLGYCLTSSSLRTLCFDDIAMNQYQLDLYLKSRTTVNRGIRRLDLLPIIPIRPQTHYHELLHRFSSLEVLSCLMQFDNQFFENLTKTNVINLILSSCANSVNELSTKLAFIAKMPRLEHLEVNLKNPLNVMEEFHLLKESTTLRTITIGTCKTYYKRANQTAADLKEVLPNVAFHIVQIVI